MSSIKVSILIDNYNYAPFLPATIDSALSQTYHDIEVVVVDDGSTDGSREILKTYGSRITTILQTNGGQASAFNRGFEKSTGQLIAFLDSDDLLAPDAIETVVSNWREEYSKMHFPLTVIASDGTPTGLMMPRCKLAQGSLASTVLASGYYVTAPTSGNVYSRSFLEQVLPMPEKEWEQGSDSYLNTHAVFFGNIGAVHRPLGYYRFHGNSMSTVVSTDSIRVSQIKKLLTHQLRQKTLVETIAAEKGLPLKTRRLRFHWSYLKLELALLRMSDADRRRSPFSLLRSAWTMITSTLRSRDVPLLRRAQLIAWTIAVVTLPKVLAIPVIRIGFEIAPQSRLISALRRA
jgi:glycosyltransferase involved in cell wall biosynthesis